MYRSLLLLALLGSAVQAAKPPAPPSGTNSPEVIYTLAGGRGYELKVANEDGTGAVTLFKSSQLVIGKLGPRNDQSLVFWDGGNLILMYYDTAATGVIERSRHILLNNGREALSPFDFSGTDIAWWHPNTGDVHVYNLASASDTVIANVPDLAGISFNAAHTEIYYGVYSSVGGAPQYDIHRISLDGGSPTRVGISSNAPVFDSGHRSDSFVLARPVSGTWHIEYIPAGASSGNFIARGIEASFRCDDRVVIYRQSLSNKNYDVLKYDLQTGTSSIFSTDNGVKFASYMPTCRTP